MLTNTYVRILVQRPSARNVMLLETDTHNLRKRERERERETDRQTDTERQRQRYRECSYTWYERVTYDPANSSIYM